MHAINRAELNVSGELGCTPFAFYILMVSLSLSLFHSLSLSLSRSLSFTRSLSPRHSIIYDLRCIYQPPSSGKCMQLCHLAASTVHVYLTHAPTYRHVCLRMGCRNQQVDTHTLCKCLPVLSHWNTLYTTRVPTLCHLNCPY